MEENTDAPIPDILFKYCDEGVLAGLDSETMMFSKPLDLNDPYEFLPALGWLFGQGKHQRGRRLFLRCLGYRPSKEVPGCIVADRANHWIRKVSGDWFVTSLSGADHNPRMWAQYGGNHTGIKLTLKLPKKAKDNLFKVDYKQSSRVDISKITDPNLSDQEKGELMRNLATRKGKDWEHETEFRWIIKPEKVPESFTRLLNGKMKAFIPFSDDWIQRVTVGYRSSESLLTSLFEIRKKRNAQWEVAKEKLSLNSFQFEDELLQIPDERRK